MKRCFGTQSAPVFAYVQLITVNWRKFDIQLIVCQGWICYAALLRQILSCRAYLVHTSLGNRVLVPEG